MRAARPVDDIPARWHPSNLLGGQAYSQRRRVRALSSLPPDGLWRPYQHRNSKLLMT
jgi:hypothetical protein